MVAAGARGGAQIAASSGVVKINRFRGLNLWNAHSLLRDDELTEAINLRFGNQGELKVRDGFQGWGANSPFGAFGGDAGSIVGWCFPQSAGNPVLIAEHNSHLYTAIGSGSNWIDRGGDTSYLPGAQYKDWFFTGGGHYYDAVAGTLVHPPGMPVNTDGIGALTLHENRIFMSDKHGGLPSRLYFSEAGAPDLTWPALNAIDVAPGDGKISQLITFKNALYIFKTTGIWALFTGPDPSNWVLRNITHETGIVGHTAQLFQNLIFFVGYNGVFTFNGASLQRISDPIQTIWEQGISQTDRETSAIWEDQFIIWVEFVGVRRIFVYNIKWQGWTEWVLNEPGKEIASLMAVPFEGRRDSTGAVIASRLYASFADSGNAMYSRRQIDGNKRDMTYGQTVSLQTKSWDFGDPISMKRIKWIGLLARFTTAVFSHIGRGTPVTMSGDGTDIEQKFAGPGYAREYAFRIDIADNAAHEFIVYQAQLAVDHHGRYAEAQLA